MSLHTIFLVILAIAFLIGIPVAVIWMFVDMIRGKKRDVERPNGGGSVSAFVGAGLTELDRLLARPSIEHQIETENPVLEREDDSGGSK